MFKRPHRLESRIAALVALTLFIAQMGAIAHAYTHKPSTARTSAYQQIAIDIAAYVGKLAAGLVTGSSAMLNVSNAFAATPANAPVATGNNPRPNASGDR